jgi:hypothetical protein
MEKPIAKAKLLYKLDLTDARNLHKHIDDKPNLLVIIKLKNGRLVAGFSESAIYQGVQSHGTRGVIMCLTNQKAYFPKTTDDQGNPKAHQVVAYDDYYYILGNSEIRLRSNEKKLFANFGIGNAYFQNNKEKVEVLLDQGPKREVEIESYEFYQLTLDEKKSI